MPGIGAFALSYFESVYKGLPKPLLLMPAHADLKEIDWQRIEGFTPQEILDYFAKEVFEKQTPEIQDFLLRASVLPHMTPSMANALIGYEINFNRYFYRYTPPRPLEEIEAELRAIEGDIVRMLAELTGTAAGP